MKIYVWCYLDKGYHQSWATLANSLKEAREEFWRDMELIKLKPKKVCYMTVPEKKDLIKFKDNPALQTEKLAKWID